MKITKLEEVTRTYCDNCGNEVKGTRYVMTIPNGESWDVCGGYIKGQSCQQEVKTKIAMESGDRFFE